MKDVILRMHLEMEQAITHLGVDITDTNLIDQSYHLADQYWRRVKQQVRASGFRDDAEEIEFFKYIKPKFTGLLEFYLLLFRYQVHAEEGNPFVDQMRRDEAAKIVEFRQKHAFFIDYFDKGLTDWDSQYFLRRKFNRVQRPPSHVYDRAAEFWTNGDWILTIYHGNSRFEDFLRHTAPGYLPST
jgi:hypothetical protein